MKRITFLIVILGIFLISGLAISATWYDSVPQQQTIVDYGSRTDGQPVYIGWSQYGKDSGNYSWTIIKIVYDTDGNFSQYVFANGNANPSKSWDSRLVYTYTTSD